MICRWFCRPTVGDYIQEHAHVKQICDVYVDMEFSPLPVTQNCVRSKRKGVKIQTFYAGYDHDICYNFR